MENFNLYDAKKQFLLAIQEVGIQAPEVVIGDGRLRRFATGVRRRDQNGWYVLHLDRRPSGSFGCWRRGISETWHAGQKNSLTPSQSRAISRQAEQARIQRQQAAVNQQKKAAKRAAELWRSLKPAPANHAYLARKMVEPNGARITSKGWLALPVVDFSERLCSVQFVAPDGQKRLFPGARKKACFIQVSASEDLQNESMPLAIAEGFSTACTVAADHPSSYTIAAIDCHNLRAVAVDSRVKWLGRTITIFGDDDRKSPTNPGRTAAIEAAKVADCQLEFPAFPEGAPNDLSDFNDLSVWKSRGSTNG